MQIKSKTVDLAKTNDMLQLPGLTLLKNSTAACLTLHNDKRLANKSEVILYADKRRCSGNPKGVSSGET
jgi:hypothetical protein